MKALLMRISAGIIALGAMLYFLACTPSTQNYNQNSSPAQNQMVEKQEPRDLGPCDYGSNPGHIGERIKGEMKVKMPAALKRLLKDSDNPAGTFTIEIQKAPNKAYFEAYITGRVSGDDNLKALSNILNDFQDKASCLRVVHFLSDSTRPATFDSGFEWSSCEYPMVVCPTGVCCYPAAGNSNSNGNTNANSNANSNSNANRGGNTNN